MRDKDDGRHRWVKSVAWELTDNQAAAMAGGAFVNLGDHTPIRYVVGCYDCGLAYHQCRLAPCYAEARP